MEEQRGGQREGKWEPIHPRQSDMRKGGTAFFLACINCAHQAKVISIPSGWYGFLTLLSFGSQQVSPSAYTADSQPLLCCSNPLIPCLNKGRKCTHRVYRTYQLVYQKIWKILLLWKMGLDLKIRFLRGASGKELTCQCRRCKRHGFDPWVGKSPWSRKWQHSSILAWRSPWTEEPGEGYSP